MFTFLGSYYFWYRFGFLGDASLTAPLALIVFAWLSVTDLRLGVNWLLAVFATGGLVFISKLINAFTSAVIFPQVDFSVISGHAAMSALLMPCIFALLFVTASGKFSRIGWLFGCAFCGLIIYSRMRIEAHPLSELTAGVLIGLLIGALFLRYFSRRELFVTGRPFVILTMLAACWLFFGKAAPVHQIIYSWF